MSFTIGDIPANVTTPPCPSCGGVETFTVTTRQLFDYSARQMHIQHVFPEMSNDDRERFISGFCGPCWTATFEGFEDDEDEI